MLTPHEPSALDGTPDPEVEVDETKALVGRLQYDLLLLGAEVTRLHGALMETQATLRSSLEKELSFTVRGRVEKLTRVLRPVLVQSGKLTRVGSPADGGYVVIDDFDEVCGLLSGGAGDNVDFEIACLAHNFPIHVYDHTVSDLPVEGSGCVHFREPLGTTGISLSEALSRLPSRGDLLMKLDIDGGEWGFLTEGQVDLTRFRQIVIELHGLHSLSDSLWFEKALQALEFLHSTHAPFHLNINNNGAYAIVGGVPLPDILEVSYLRRDTFEHCDHPRSWTDVPGTANDTTKPAYSLGCFPLAVG